MVKIPSSQGQAREPTGELSFGHWGPKCNYGSFQGSGAFTKKYGFHCQEYQKGGPLTFGSLHMNRIYFALFGSPWHKHQPPASTPPKDKQSVWGPKDCVNIRILHSGSKAQAKGDSRCHVFWRILVWSFGAGGKGPQFKPQ